MPSRPETTEVAADGGALLRAERLRRGYTQRQAAAAAGVTHRVICTAESGRVPRAANAHKLATFYGLDVMVVWPDRDTE